jgi:cell division protein FtsW
VDPVEVVPIGAPPPVPPDLTAHSLPIAMSHLLLGRPTIYLGLAMLAMAGAALLPVRRLAGGIVASPRLGLWILGLGCVTLLVVLATAYLPGLSREVNGSRRWIALPLPGLRKTSIQPSEFVKWGLIVVLALYCSCRAAVMSSFWRGLLPGLLATGLLAGAVAKEDLGTGVLIASAASLVLIAAGARLWHFLMFVPPAAVGFLVLVVSSPYRLERIKTFIDPYLDPQGSGYHMIQSMAAVHGGEGFGRGLGFGLQKFGYLPEDTTDFLFAVICEELGIAGATVVVALYAALLWASLNIVRRQTSPVLKLIGLGILSTVGLQTLMNLMVVTGLGPTKGIALPLISSGGTGWILTAASLGLLVAMDRAARSVASAAIPDRTAPQLATA